MAKQRADQLLVDRGLAESRTRAQALILAGLAFIGDRKIDKAGQQLAEDAAISVKGRDHPWREGGEGARRRQQIGHGLLGLCGYGGRGEGQAGRRKRRQQAGANNCHVKPLQ